MVFLCKHRTWNTARRVQIPGCWKAFSQCSRGGGGGSCQINCRWEMAGAALLLAAHIALHSYSHVQLKNGSVSLARRYCFGYRFTQWHRLFPRTKHTWCDFWAVFGFRSAALCDRMDERWSTELEGCWFCWSVLAEDVVVPCQGCHEMSRAWRRAWLALRGELDGENEKRDQVLAQVN